MGSPKYTPMLIAIQRDKYYSVSVPEQWAEYLQACSVDVRWVDLASNDFVSQLEGCDGLMWQRGHKSQDKIESQRILHSIELYLGLPVFPDYNISWHYDEKLSQYYLLQAAGVPTPKTWVFWEKGRALEWAGETDYPKVFKLSAGSSGMNVVKVRTSNEATKLIHRMFGPGIYGGQVELDSKKRTLPWWKHLKALALRWKSAVKYIISGEPPIMPGSAWRLEKGYAYFQEFIPHEFETRVYVIGDTAWGLRRFPPPGDFRASRGLPFGGSFDVDPAEIDTRCIRMAFELSERLGFESMKYDFISKDGELVLSELDYTVGRGRNLPILDFPGTWNRNIEWVTGIKRHAECQVEVFLKRVKSTESAPVAKVRIIPEGRS